MSGKEVADSDVGRFHGFGYPRETRPDEISDDPTLKRMLVELNADKEAKRLRKEAEINTPEGRKKAAEAAEAELTERRRAWGTRVVATPLDGFVGIHDSAKDRELQIYTRTYDLKHKFWGVKPAGMTIWDFWDIHDPEVRRYYDANQETPASPEPSKVAPLPTNPPQRSKSVAKSRRRQKSSDINPTHRVTKSTTPKVINSTRKSLAHKIDAGDPSLEDQVRDVKGAVRGRGRPTRNKPAVTVSSVQQKSAKAKSTVQDKISPSPKRPRGRPRTKENSTGRPSDQKKIPAVKGNARIIKSSQTESRPSAPSTHKMRTRRSGPVEFLQLP